MRPRDACRASSLRVAKLAPEFARKATISEDEEEFKVNSGLVCSRRPDILGYFNLSFCLAHVCRRCWEGLVARCLLSFVGTFCPKPRHVNLCAQILENNNSNRRTTQDVWSLSAISGTQTGRLAGGKTL